MTNEGIPEIFRVVEEPRVLAAESRSGNSNARSARRHQYEQVMRSPYEGVHRRPEQLLPELQRILRPDWGWYAAAMRFGPEVPGVRLYTARPRNRTD